MFRPPGGRPDREGIVEDRGVGEAAHGEIVEPFDGAGMDLAVGLVVDLEFVGVTSGWAMLQDGGRAGRRARRTPMRNFARTSMQTSGSALGSGESGRPSAPDFS